LRHGPEHPLPDPAGALAFLAARSKTVQLGTGIIILPQRNPLRLAKDLEWPSSDAYLAADLPTPRNCKALT
jgi:hypothetical protein